MDKFFIALRFSEIAETYRQEVCEFWDEAIANLSMDTLQTKQVWPHAYIADESSIIRWVVSGDPSIEGMNIQLAQNHFQNLKKEEV